MGHGRMEVQFAATPTEQEAQLRAWDLEAEPLIEVVLWARGFYLECTALHPRGYKFIHAYAEAGRRLRELHLDAWVERLRFEQPDRNSA